MTKKANKKAFTLVELIIVITILAILGTIGFISFQGYTKDARDTNRISTLKQLQNGLELYFVKTGNFPLPDNITGTGEVGRTPIIYVGSIGKEISEKIGFNKTPIDPLSNTNYVYGVSVNTKKYQIGATMENLQSSIIIPTAYASQYQAKVIGNYTYPLKIGTILYSLPSLIFVGTGNLINNSTGFVINKSQNLPYSLGGNLQNTIETKELLKEITGTSATNLSLTGIDMSAYATSQEFKNLTGTTLTDLETTFGITKDELGSAIFGNDYYSDTIISNVGGGTIPETPPSETYSCSGTLTIANADITNNTALTANANYQTTNSSNSCYYTCKTNYSGDKCEIYTNPNSITSTICDNAGWGWVTAEKDDEGDGFCISPRITGGTELISWMDIGTNYGWNIRGSSKTMVGNASNV